MIKGAKLPLVTALAAIVGAIAGNVIINSLRSNTATDHSKFLMQAASEFNVNLPINIDAETILFSTIGTGNKFTYNMKMPNYEKENLDIEAFVTALTPNITNSVCTVEDMKVFRDMKVIVAYRYFDSNQKQITEIQVNTTDCKTL